MLYSREKSLWKCLMKNALKMWIKWTGSNGITDAVQGGESSSPILLPFRFRSSHHRLPGKWTVSWKGTGSLRLLFCCLFTSGLLTIGCQVNGQSHKNRKSSSLILLPLHFRSSYHRLPGKWTLLLDSLLRTGSLRLLLPLRHQLPGKGTVSWEGTGFVSYPAASSLPVVYPSAARYMDSPMKRNRESPILLPLCFRSSYHRLPGKRTVSWEGTGFVSYPAASLLPAFLPSAAR